MKNIIIILCLFAPTWLMSQDGCFTLTTTTAPENCAKLGIIYTKVLGGVQPYTYRSSNGYTWSSVATTSSLAVPAGNYSITVTDATGACVIINSNIIVANQNISSLNAVTEPRTCGSLGSAIVTPIGGTPPYTYAWSNGATTNSINNLVGTYDVTVTDAGGCSKIKGVTIEDRTLSMTVAIQPQTCTKLGSAAVTVLGGKAPFTYLWSTGQTTSSLQGLNSRNYSVTVTDANGCTAINRDIYVEFKYMYFSVYTDPYTCSSQGKIYIIPTNGAYPFRYQWSNGSTDNPLQYLQAGTYSVTITDSEGCVETISPIVEDKTMSLSINADPVTCNSAGKISLTPQNGRPPYAYRWSDGSSFATLQNLQAGTYTVTATDAGSCIIVKSINIVNQVQTVTINATVEQITCTNNFGKISLTPSGGTAPYSYTWSNGAAGNSLQNLQVGTYSVTATDANGCKATQSIAIVNQVQTLIINTVVEPRTCDKFGKISLTILGGIQPYIYQWSNGLAFNSPTSSPLLAGTYSVTVTDGSGCSAVKSNILIEDKCSTNYVCFNQVYFYTPDPSTPNYQQLFATIEYNRTTPLTLFMDVRIFPPGTTTYPAPIRVQVIIPAGSGTTNINLAGYAGGNPRLISTTEVILDFASESIPYKFDFIGGFCVTPTGCCIGKVKPPCNLTATTSIPNLGSCSVKPTILATASGGTQPYVYKWSSGATTAQVDVPEGDYTVTITDANSCAASKSITVANPCPLDCAKYIDNCRTEWEQFILKNYASGKCKQWETDCSLSADIRRDGKVYIGLSPISISMTMTPIEPTIPSGFNLAVAGGVIANDVKVKLCNNGTWCDYVFDDKYKLMPIAEMNKYIRQNKRLPNMPSTADITKEAGYDITKLTLLQQEKIEEAYLHLIKLEEKIKRLKETVAAKKQKNKKITQLLNK
jgi:SprB repeat